MDFWQQVETLTQEITSRVGVRLMEDFGGEIRLRSLTSTAETKSDGSLVTQSDLWADGEIKRSLQAAFPDHAVLSEEDFHLFTDTPWTWVIDPIDGTTNFAMGLPLWGISIGLLYHGHPVFGRVYFPPVNQSFHGFWRGESGLVDMPQGAWLNGQPIHTSTAALTKNHLFGICARSLGVIKTRLPAKLRMIGVTTYSFLAVAAGFTLGGVEATPKIWDLAAVWPIFHAAGGTWISLSADRIFPAEVGKNYGGHPLPSLVLARSELTAAFEAPIRAGLAG
jgi:myo-inositol-1(or 4)-monophosphatase